MADDAALWEPERLRNVGSVLARYGAHIAPGHRVRLGMEGDPCAVYRAAAEAPCATVLDVQRDPGSGLVRFRAQLDGSPAVVELDNRSVSPDRLWEIAPDYLDTFRGHVDAAAAGAAHDAAEPPPPEPPPPDPLDEYRSAVNGELEALRGRLAEVEERERTLREDLATAVRELAGDVVRAYRGEPAEFAQRYADRYDLAVAERAASDDDEYRAAAEARRARGAGRHDDRHEFDCYRAEPPSSGRLDFDEAPSTP
jgi:hypothetical protein